MLQGQTVEVDRSIGRDLSEERELIKRAVAGDSESRTNIVLAHQRNVYNLALRLMGNEHEAECVLQDTFLKVFEKLPEFRAESQLGTWIHRIAANAALMRLRKKKNKHFVPIEDEPRKDDEEANTLSFVVKSLDRDPLELTMDEELRVKLGEAIESLPVNLRFPFVLKDLEGLSMAEIAEETGKTVAAVKADLHRARVKLRGMLAEFVAENENG